MAGGVDVYTCIHVCRDGLPTITCLLAHSCYSAHYAASQTRPTLNWSTLITTNRLYGYLVEFSVDYLLFVILVSYLILMVYEVQIIYRKVYSYFFNVLLSLIKSLNSLNHKSMRRTLILVPLVYQSQGEDTTLSFWLKGYKDIFKGDW